MKHGAYLNMSKSQYSFLNGTLPRQIKSPYDLTVTSPFTRRDSGMFSSESFHEGLKAREFNTIAKRVASLRIPPSPAAMDTSDVGIVITEKSLTERLFDATAQVKILTSQVAMHLSNEWRGQLFRQLDQLHDPEEWEKGDPPLERASFATFLKAIFDLKPTVRPGLGLSNNGYLVAAWTANKDRLTLQFLPHDKVKWVISRYLSDELEQVAGNTSVKRLGVALEPYTPRVWFEHAEIRPTTR